METQENTKTWVLYLLECANGKYYCGITNDMEARYAAHISGRGAKFTRANPPKRVVASFPFPGRSEASRAEYAVKQVRRGIKLATAAHLSSTAMATP
jgi:putative endonuclease